MNRNIRKFLDLILIIISIIFIMLGVFGHFIFKKLSFQDFILGTFGFGACALIGMIYFTSKHRDWFIPKEKLTRSQTIIMAICGFIFSIGSLWISITGNLHFVLRMILFVGFLFFGIGSIILLSKNIKTVSR